MEKQTLLLPAYDPDMAHPLINGIEYPYSIMGAFKKFSEMGFRFMGLGIDDYRAAVRQEKRERLIRYNFI
jgi:hypothetical protein